MSGSSAYPGDRQHKKPQSSNHTPALPLWHPVHEGMHLLNRCIFIAAHEAGNLGFYPTYRRLIKNQWRKFDALKDEQEKQLRQMVDFAYRNVLYYHKLFNHLRLKPDDIRTIRDLEKLPLLNKEIINKNPDDFKPHYLKRIKYSRAATGGTTGVPLEYRLSSYDRFLGGALLYRGWGYAGFQLGDRMVFLAGASLDIGTKSALVSRAHELARNLKKLSSFDMGDREMKDYARVINDFRPRFIRGYASSLYFFAGWLEKNDVKVHEPDGVFTTSEKLYPVMREKIADVFGCPVFDTYGLYDGGISAFECPEHAGMHVDTERSVLEVVGGNGEQVDDGKGLIIATSLYNYAMPFLRYDTGDDGHIVDEPCACGRGYKLLTEVNGRTVDVLVTPEGRSVHGWFFLYIFWELQGVREYQVIQETLDRIVIKIAPEEGFDERQLERIRQVVRGRSEGWNLEFRFVDSIERTGSGKYKFIKNNYIKQSP
jgi:phenylacetate-CoA ligase